MNKNITRILINTLFGIVLIFMWSRMVSVEMVMGKLVHTNVWTILFCVLLLTLGGTLRGTRLWVLLPKGDINLKNSIFLTLLSQCLSFIIPIRLGEITKGLYLSTQSKHLSLPKALIWIFTDRFIDFWSVFFLVCITIPFLPVSLSPSIRQSIILLSVLMTVLLIVIIYYSNLIKKIVLKILLLLRPLSIRTHLQKFVTFLFESFAVLPKDPTKQLVLLSLTFLSWTLEGTAWFLLLKEVGIQDPSFLTAFVGTLLLALSFLIPSAPGYVGTLQAAGVVIFSYILGYDQLSISAASVLFNIVMLFASLIPGLISLYVLDIKLGELWKRNNNNKPISH